MYTVKWVEDGAECVKSFRTHKEASEFCWDMFADCGLVGVMTGEAE